MKEAKNTLCYVIYDEDEYRLIILRRNILTGKYYFSTENNYGVIFDGKRNRIIRFEENILTGKYHLSMEEL